MQLFSRSRPSVSCTARAATLQKLAAATTLTLLAGCATPAGPGITTPAVRVADGTQAKLALLETTDLHTNILSYDYYKLGEDRSIGFERTAALIAAARKEFTNTLLFDNGDTIQGTALSDYQAQVKRLQTGLLQQPLEGETDLTKIQAYTDKLLEMMPGNLNEQLDGRYVMAGSDYTTLPYNGDDKLKALVRGHG